MLKAQKRLYYITAGLPDDAFLHTDAPMTMRVVRAVSIGMLSPRVTDVVWYIGAATGSVGTEYVYRSPPHAQS